MAVSNFAPLIISLVSAAISLTTLWFSVLHRGSIKMTRPRLVALLRGDGPVADAPKIFMRMLLFSTGKRGQTLESLFAKVHQKNSSQLFLFWATEIRLSSALVLVSSSVQTATLPTTTSCCCLIQPSTASNPASSRSRSTALSQDENGPACSIPCTFLCPKMQPKNSSRILLSPFTSIGIPKRGCIVRISKHDHRNNALILSPAPDLDLPVGLDDSEDNANYELIRRPHTKPSASAVLQAPGGHRQSLLLDLGHQ
jgi:hypothetical protein